MYFWTVEIWILRKIQLLNPVQICTESNWRQAKHSRIHRLQPVVRLNTVDRFQTHSWLHTVMGLLLCPRVDGIEILHAQAWLYPISLEAGQVGSLEGGQGQGVKPLKEPCYQGQGAEPLAEPCFRGQGVEPLTDPCYQGQGVQPLADPCPGQIHRLLITQKGNEQVPRNLGNELQLGLFHERYLCCMRIELAGGNPLVTDPPRTNLPYLQIHNFPKS